MYYLYVKTHNQTGLKYLGQTSRNPYNYKGSGKRWLNHITKHGNDVTTEILFETNNKIEICEQGKFYSQLWHVVTNSNWANIVPEEGAGGDTSMSENYKKSLINRDLSYKNDIEYKRKVSTSVKQMWETKFRSDDFDHNAYTQMCSDRSKAMWETRGISDEDRRKRSDTMKQYVNDNPEYAERISESIKKQWQEKSNLYEVTYPDGKKEQITCLRGWCKEQKLPYYTLYNSIRYNRVVKGWQVKIINDKSNS
jgi:hypothetical protein